MIRGTHRNAELARMSPDDLVVATEAHDYPLTLDHLLHTGLTCAPAREIVHEDRRRLDYRELRRRIGRLAAGLASLGVNTGATVAVMDWDSTRYPRVLLRGPDDGRGAAHHQRSALARADPLHHQPRGGRRHPRSRGLHPLIAQIGERFERAPKLVLMRDDDGASAPDHGLDFAAEYESLLGRAGDGYDFPVLDERTRATTFYTTGTTGDPKGRVVHPSPARAAHPRARSAPSRAAAPRARLHRDDVYMPITPMFHVHAWGMPFVATVLGIKQVYPGRYEPEKLLRLIDRERGDVLALRADHPAHAARLAGRGRGRPRAAWKVVVGGSAMSAGLARAAMDRGIDVFGG